MPTADSSILSGATSTLSRERPHEPNTRIQRLHTGDDELRGALEGVADVASGEGERGADEADAEDDGDDDGGGGDDDDEDEDGGVTIVAPAKQKNKTIKAQDATTLVAERTRGERRGGRDRNRRRRRRSHVVCRPVTRVLRTKKGSAVIE